ncbi:TPA: hypothetical protein ACMDVK_004476 [Vibrio parahaemolyticus]|uniref:hypothetical protein n=1 Tax=Vibrio parahaemolyticus TaxID=670 RepID=UPI0004A33BB8|nr:hypothetical protein [Vibrio parahaemolyticus]EGR2205844.1 hypothetical protein [Vibrio parahaemolyticus]MCC3818015.1 hypothetical protein [Vibrio parahaemolyticus]MCC3854679.1 hypothetical protein [Vibrio parahaemolyticus]
MSSSLSMKSIGDFALKGTKSVASRVNPLDAIDNIANHVTTWQTIKQQEETKRHEISAKRDVLIENIRAERDAFMEVIQQNYKERAIVYKELFERLDQSISSGNIEIAQLAMSGIVEQIKNNPLPTYVEFKTALENNQPMDF